MRDSKKTDAEETKLRAELAIVRSHLKKLEKENSELRREKSLFYLNKYEEEKEYKRRLNMFQKEYQIKSTQNMSTDKENTVQNLLVRSQIYHNLHVSASADPSRPVPGLLDDPRCLDNASIDLRYALKMSINLDNLGSKEEVEKLKFFRDYFFDDFYSIDTDAVIRAIQKANLDTTSFIAIFKLFCCKKAVFDAFCTRALEAPFFLKEQIYIVENVPLDWVCDCITSADEQHRGAGDDPGLSVQGERSSSRNNGVKSFVIKNSRSLLGFLGSLAETRPSLLKAVLMQDTFDHALEKGGTEARRLVALVCKHGGLGYMNEKNIHLISKQDLFACYGGDILI